jgi:hypothetical protein
MSVTISASVGQGGANRDPDVRKVQSLLNRVPPEQGGPSIPLKVDGLCFGKTLAAIEKFQHIGCGMKWPDKRVDPGRRTWIELSKYDGPEPARGNVITCFPPPGTRGSTFVPTGSFASLAPGAVTADSLVKQARARIPTAIGWVSTTMARLARVRSMIERFKVYTRDEIKSFDTIETHFKVRIPATQDVVARERIDKIYGVYALILKTLGELSTSRLVGDPALRDKAQAPLGGFSDPSCSVKIGADFANSNANMQTAVLIHECAHFVDASCTHVASELPAPFGSAITDQFGLAANPSGKNYQQMDYGLAIQNAYSFAQCALHHGLGIDKRPP